MNRNLLIIILIIVIGGLISYSAATRKPQRDWSQPVMAERGEIVEGFPSELVLTPDSRITASYKADLKDGGTAYVATMEAPETYKSAYFRYVDFLKKNGYDITSRPFFDDRAAISSRKGEDVLDIQISSNPHGGSGINLMWTSKTQ